MSLFLKEVKFGGKEAHGFRAGNRLLIALSVSALLLFMVQAQETVTLTNYANILRGLNYFQLGLIYLVNGAAVVATQGIFYKVTKRIGNYMSYAIGTFVYTAGFLSYAFDTRETIAEPDGKARSSPIVRISVEISIPVRLVSKAYERKPAVYTKVPIA